MYYYSNELAHYGLKGMKWGQRRWQYDDGRFNDAGKARYFGQNSTHRPDSVRVLQGDKPKASSGSQPGSFDRDRAKKIAKNVAIGAAVVGGTVLVAYGGYKIHQMGGIQKVSQDLTAKMRETKLENLKLKEDFKAQKATIKAEGKKNLAQIKENTKTNLKSISENGKLERRMLEIDPEGKIDREVLKSELQKQDSAAKAVWNKTSSTDLGAKLGMRGSTKSINNADKSLIKTLSDKDLSRLNSGEISLKELSRERSVPTKTKSTAQIVREYKKEHPNTTLTPSKIVENYKGAAKTVSSTAKSVANTTKAAASTAKSVTSSVKASTKSVPKLTLTPDAINAGSNFLAQATKSYQTVSQINRENSKSSSKAKKGQKAVDDYTKELLKKGA